MQTIYFAGGCLWGTQEFVKTLPGVVATGAARANGASDSLEGPYDGYAECARTTFDKDRVTAAELMGYFFEIIDLYSVNRQGADVGEKYRTGVYSEDPSHLREAETYIWARSDRDRVRIEVLALIRLRTNISSMIRLARWASSDADRDTSRPSVAFEYIRSRYCRDSCVISSSRQLAVGMITRRAA